MELIAEEQCESSIREGFKRTEVGVIPVDWCDPEEIKKLAIITTGNKNTQDKIEDGEYPFFVRSPTVERINSYSFDGEAVLTAGDGVGTGKIFHYINGKFDFHQRVYKISHFRDDVDGYFFYLYFSNHFFDRIMSMTAKSSVDSVRREMIADMKIPLPPTITEQVAIATALSDVDALICSLDKLIAKKNAIKQGAMQQLLKSPKQGGKRLAGFEGEWEVDVLGNIVTITTGKKNTQDKVEDGIFPFFVRSETIEKINSYSFDGEAILTAGDGVGTGKIFHYINGKFDFHQRVYKISHFKEGINGYYIYLYFSNNFFERIMSLTAKSSVDSVRREMITEMEIPLPPTLDEQQAIANILSDMDAEIDALEKKKSKYQSIKQGMMQELLTGKTRLV